MQRMGMTVEMETEDFEAAAQFLETFGSFVKDHNQSMNVRITGCSVMAEEEVGATQPTRSGGEPMVAIDQEPEFLPIDTPAYDIATDPGRFAFEEEG